MWGHFLGRGFVDPVDDLRPSNAPAAPAVLDALAADFVASGFDAKHLVRVIVGSEAYGLSAAPLDAASAKVDPEVKLWERFRVTPMGPDEMLAALVERDAPRQRRARHREARSRPGPLPGEERLRLPLRRRRAERRARLRGHHLASPAAAQRQRRRHGRARAAGERRGRRGGRARGRRVEDRGAVPAHALQASHGRGDRGVAERTSPTRSRPRPTRSRLLPPPPPRRPARRPGPARRSSPTRWATSRTAAPRPARTRACAPSKTSSGRCSTRASSSSTTDLAGQRPCKASIDAASSAWAPAPSSARSSRAGSPRVVPSRPSRHLRPPRPRPPSCSGSTADRATSTRSTPSRAVPRAAPSRPSRPAPRG